MVVSDNASKEDKLRCQFAGTGYYTKQGILNLQAGENLPPSDMTEEQLESHLVEVAMAQQYK